MRNSFSWNDSSHKIMEQFRINKTKLKEPVLKNNIDLKTAQLCRSHIGKCILYNGDCFLIDTTKYSFVKIESSLTIDQIYHYYISQDEHITIIKYADFLGNINSINACY